MGPFACWHFWKRESWQTCKSGLDIELGLGLVHSQVCWSDLKPQVDTYICTAWQGLGNNETRNKLYEIRPNLKESLCNTTQPLYRKQETVMTRLRIGHTWITHSYLLKKEDQPFCHACDNPFTVKHILVECSDFTHIRNKYYTTTDVHTFPRGWFLQNNRISQGNQTVR